jgi:hypothetical protein
LVPDPDSPAQTHGFTFTWYAPTESKVNNPNFLFLEKEALTKFTLGETECQFAVETSHPAPEVLAQLSTSKIFGLQM